MEWIKKTLFGRQLSHGSDNEVPETFEQALQQQNSFEDQQYMVSQDFSSKCMALVLYIAKLLAKLLIKKSNIIFMGSTKPFTIILHG